MANNSAKRGLAGHHFARLRLGVDLNLAAQKGVECGLISSAGF